MEWRTDVALVREEVNRDQHRLWFPDPDYRGFRQGDGRAAARSGWAMSGAATAWRRVVVIEIDVSSGGGRGKRSSNRAEITACAGVRAQDQPKDQDTGRREPRRPPISTSSTLTPDHCNATTP
jgi:hypothetical protein